MRAAIYARVSSKAQADRHTIQGQLGLLRPFVAAQGWTLAGEYIDDGRSAKTGQLEKRDGFARLMRDAAARAFDILVVVDIDRLTRTDSIEERASILGPFQRLGIDIVTPSGGRLDLRSFLGEFWVTIQALVAAEENRKRGERTRAGKARSAAIGRKPGGPTPFGYCYDPGSGAWSVDEPAAALVRELYERVADGEASTALDAELAARGVLGARGEPWPRGRVWKLVTSTTYRGRYVVSRRSAQAVAVPPLVDDRLWHLAQDALADNGRKWLRRTVHVYLLEGRGICADCGTRIMVNSHGDRSPSTYACAQRARPDRSRPTCRLPHHRTAATDEAVWTALARYVRQPGRLERLAAAQLAAVAADARTWQDDLKSAKAALARLQRAEEAILARFRRGIVSEAAFDAELAASARQRAMLDEQVAAAERAAFGAERQADAASQLRDRIAELRDLVIGAEPAERFAIAQAIIGPRAAVFYADRIVLGACLGSQGSSRTGSSTNAANPLRFELIVRRAA